MRLILNYHRTPSPPQPYEAAAKESGDPFLEPSEHHLKIAVVLAESGSGDSNLYPSME